MPTLFLSCSKEEIELSIHDCSCFINTAEDTYLYPIRPGSDKWDSITTSGNFMNVTQVSIEILEKMSTKGLMETCLENPMFFDLYLSETPQLFFDFFHQQYRVCKELVDRKDSMVKLIERYSLMCLDCNENNYSSYYGKGGETMYAFDEIELLMAQNGFLNQISHVGHLELAKLVLAKYEEKIILNASQYHQTFSVWLAARIMLHDGYSEIKELIDNNIEIEYFVNQGSIILPQNGNVNVEIIHYGIITSLKNYLK